jgi:hypothetical protein
MTMTKNTNECVDITSELHSVTGGAGRGQAVGNAIKKGYQAVRPIIKETSDVVKELGVIGAAGYGAKKLWDSVSGGGGNQQPAQPTQPAP